MRARATTAVITQLPGRSFLVSVDPIPWALSTAADIAAHAINIHNFFQTSLLLVLCPVGVPGYYIAVKHALSFASLRGWQHCWNRNEEKSEQEKQHDLYTYNKSAMTTSSKVCLAKVWEKKNCSNAQLMELYKLLHTGSKTGIMEHLLFVYPLTFRPPPNRHVWLPTPRFHYHATEFFFRWRLDFSAIETWSNSYGRSLWRVEQGFWQ